MKNRCSGILLHIISLPSEYGIGDTGRNSRRFVELLAGSGQHLWQVLPLNPTDPSRGNIPYSSFSAFGCNFLIASPELLYEDGLITSEEIEECKIDEESTRINYLRVIEAKEKLLKIAFERFKSSRLKEDFERYCIENSSWLDDHAFFYAIKEKYEGAPWNRWHEELKNREPAALSEITVSLNEKIQLEKFKQFIVEKQWLSLKKFCNEKGIRIIGDIPIYVDYDSVDVWKNPQIFKLGEDKMPCFVSGVPPDYFSKTGQLWGTPVYNWEKIREEKYRWWIERFERNFKLFDIIRIDHFRGLVAYWEVEYGAKTATSGKWVKCPSDDFFKTLIEHFGSFCVIAEDLGVITEDVRVTMSKFGFPGMKVLQFAFGADVFENPHAPHNYEKNCVVYPGTHDNNTARGWFDEEATEETKKIFFKYIGRSISSEEVAWEMIKLAWSSVAKWAIAPMQDLLALGSIARINKPAVASGNYEWRMTREQMESAGWGKLLEITEIYGRKNFPI